MSKFDDYNDQNMIMLGALIVLMAFAAGCLSMAAWEYFVRVL